MRSKDEIKDEIKCMAEALMPLDPMLGMLLYIDLSMLMNWAFDEENKLERPTTILKKTVAEQLKKRKKQQAEEEVEDEFDYVAPPFDPRKVQ